MKACAIMNKRPTTSKREEGNGRHDKTPLHLAAFRELYRSRDGKLCFFEDAKTGHLAAVDASKLA